MRKSPKFSPEVVERAARMVFDAKDQYPSQWAATESVAGKIGCTAETLRRWACPGASATLYWRPRSNGYGDVAAA